MEDSAEIEKISFPSGNHRLLGSVFSSNRAGNGRRAVLFVHGQRSSQEGYALRAQRASRELDAICLTFDLSGHGADAASFDRYSVYDHLKDVRAAYDYLAPHEAVDRARIGVCGASYGGYLSALLTGDRAVKRLILRAPSLVTDIDIPTLSGEPPLSAEASDELDSLKILGLYRGEVLVVQSERDEVVPSSHIAAHLRACLHAQHQVISEATHALTNTMWDEVFIKAILGWFRNL